MNRIFLHTCALPLYLSFVLGCFLVPFETLAQEDDGVQPTIAGTPRPKITTNFSIQLGRGGYGLRAFFAEGSEPKRRPENGGNNNSGLIHLFHEPLMYVQANEDGTLLHRIDDNGLLTLYMRWDPNPNQTLQAIHRYLDDTLDYDSSQWRIDTISIQSGFFRSSDISTGIKSQILPRNTKFQETGHYDIRFDMKSPDAAKAFLQKLHGTDEKPPAQQLEFVYSFEGIADIVCTGFASYERIQNHDRFKELLGEGGKSAVQRRQLAQLKDAIASTTVIEGRCDDLALLGQLANQAETKLGEPTRLSWNELNEYAGLNPDDFAPTLVTMLKEKNMVVTREQEQEAASMDNSWGIGGSVGGGFSGFIAKVSGNYSETDKDARQSFSDILKKEGISGEWEGREYVPKYIDVFTTENIISRLNEGVTVTYHQTGVGTDSFTFRLSKDTGWLLGDAEQHEATDVLERLEASLLNEIEQLAQRLKSLQEIVQVVEGGDVLMSAGANVHVVAEGIDHNDDGYVEEDEGGGIHIEGNRTIVITSQERSDTGSRTNIEITAQDDAIISAGDDTQINASDDFEITTGDDAIISAGDDTKINARDNVSIYGGGNVKIQSENHVKIDGKLSINDREYIDVDSCYYTVRLGKDDSDDEGDYYVSLDRGDDIAFVAGFVQTECGGNSRTQTPGLILTRAGPNNSKWMLMLDNWRSQCKVIETRIIFMNGMGIDRTHSTEQIGRTRDRVRYDEDRSWCDHD